MNNYIFADIKRILHKKSFLAAAGIYAGIFLFMMFIYFNPTFTADAYIAKTKNFLSFFPFLIGLALFLSVYYDDFKSKSMQIAIGYGIPRYKIVLSKFIESVVLFAVTALCILVIVLVAPAAMSLSLNATQITELISGVFTEMLRAIGYVTISAVPVFYTQNAVSGTICTVLLSSKTVLIFSSMILGQDFIVNSLGNLTKYLFTVQLYSAQSAFVQSGSFSLSLIPTITVYVFLPVLLSVLCFNKKELEF